MRTSMILLAVFLTACGGGGSESTTATAVPSGPHIGRLVLGGPISGVGYETATFSGTTDANGEFEYMGGERVRFFVGPLTLADQIPGAAEIDPAGLVPGSAMPETARDVRAFLQARGLGGQGGPFSPDDIFVNLLCFLYSVDQDKDPTNGIALAPSLGQVGGIERDFLLKPEQFLLRMTPWLYVVHQVGGVTNARLVRMGEALDRYASFRNLTPLVFLQATMEDDRDNDGMFETRRIVNLDNENLPLTRHHDGDGDGTIDSTTTLIADAQRDFIGLQRDSDGNGAPDAIQTAIYDIHGNPTQVTSDWNGDGQTDDVETRTYDGLGQLVRTETDSRADGTIDDITYFVFTHPGLLNRWEERVDRGNDGVFDRITAREYDEHGNLLREERDHDGDGLVDDTWIWTYNAKGLVTSQTTIGSSNFGSASTYDAMGRRTEERWDNDGNGTWDTIQEYVFVGERLTALFNDNDADGVWDQRYEVLYDSEGRFLGYDLHVDDDGIADSTWRIQYNAAGDEIGSMADWDGDGTPDQVQSKTVDAQGNVLEELADVDGDSVWDQRYVSTWVEVSFAALELYDNGNVFAPFL